MLTARTKTIERTGTGRQFPPFLASLSATKFSLQIYMEHSTSLGDFLDENVQVFFEITTELGQTLWISLHFCPRATTRVFSAEKVN